MQPLPDSEAKAEEIEEMTKYPSDEPTDYAPPPVPHPSNSTEEEHGADASHPPTLTPSAPPVAVLSARLDRIPIEYFRKHLLRSSFVACLLAIPALYLAPIVGLVIVPGSMLVAYWLRDPFRFQHGGDLRRCTNRDCSIMFFHLSCCVCIAISLLDLCIDAVSLSLSQKNENTARGDSWHRGSTTAHSTVTLRVCEIVLNALLLPLLAFCAYVSKRLRGALTSSAEAENEGDGVM